MRSLLNIKTNLLLSLIIAVACIVSANSATAEVNPDGSFSHVFPIDIPKGIDGMQPNLSLVYNSNAGNGLAGVGWSIVGVPSIKRMNWENGINYDGNDTYLGPEGRLVKVDGEDYYRSETDNSSKYTPIFTTPTGFHEPCSFPAELEDVEPCAWKVEDRQGSTWYYGEKLDSRIEAINKNGLTRAWLLTAKANRNDSLFIYSYNYDSETGDYQPASIQFTYGTELAGNKEIVFEYETRPDVRIDYSEGSKVVKTKRLKSVSIKNKGILLKKYELEYNLGLQQYNSHLTSIKTIGSDGKEYISERFEWTAAYHEDDSKINNAPILVPSGDRDFTGMSEDRYTQPGATKFVDLDGNGLADMITLAFDDSGGFWHPRSGWHRQARVNNGYSWKTANQFVPTTDRDFTGLIKTADPNKVYNGGTEFHDLNGDGRKDLVSLIFDNDGCWWGNGNWFRRILLNSGNGWQNAPQYLPSSYRDFTAMVRSDCKVERGGSKFLDLNGDGLPDMISRIYDDADGWWGYGNWHSRAYLNNGNGWQDAPLYKLPSDREFTAMVRSDNFVEPEGTEFVDLNGDGLPDIITLVHDGDGSWWGNNGWYRAARINTGAGWQNAPEFVPPDHGIFTAKLPSLGNFHGDKVYKGGSRFIDLNGDGRSDIITLNNNINGGSAYRMAHLNTGSGWEPAPQYLPPGTRDFTAIIRTDGKIESGGTEFVELNGDGLVDMISLIHDDQFGWHRQAYLNTGNGWEAAPQFVPASTRNYTAMVRADNYVQPGGTEFVDLNGDGLTDIITLVFDTEGDWWGTGGWYRKVLLNTGNGFSEGVVSQKLLLKKVKSLQGLETQIQYKNSSELSNIIVRTAESGFQSPMGIPDSQPMTLVSEVKKSGGRPSSPSYKTTYQYKNKRIFPGSITDKKDLGFESIITVKYALNGVEEIPISTKDTKYRQEALLDFDNDGSFSLNEKSPFTGMPSSITTYAGLAANNTKIYKEEFFYNESITNVELFPVAGNSEISQPLLSKKLKFNFQGGVFASTNVDSYSYDIYGRNDIHLSCVLDAAQGGESADKLTECPSNELEKIETDFVYWTLGDDWDAEQPNSMSKSVGTETLSQIRYILNTDHQVEKIEKYLSCESGEVCSGSGWTPIKQNIIYKTNGLVESEQDGKGQTTTYTYNEGLLETVAKENLTTTYGYDDWGRISSKGLSAEQTTTFSFDSLGRLKNVTNPLGGAIDYVYSDESPSINGLWRRTDSTGDTGDSTNPQVVMHKKEYFDGFGFIYKVETWSDANPSEIRTVESRKNYALQGNSFQLTVETTRPFIGSVDWNFADKKIYDEFGRLVKTIKPDNSFIEYTYSLNTVNKITTQNGEEGNRNDLTTATTLFDKKGRLNKKIDQLNNETVYQFDDLDRITNVTLPPLQSGLRQQLTVKYDSFGRRTSLNDPVLGMTTFLYDLNGNLKEQTDAKNRKTVFTYDGLDRMRFKSVNDQSTDSYTIEYKYDQLGRGESLGQITEIIDPSGSQELHYNALGNVITRVRYISSLSTNPFTEQTAYSRFGKPLTYIFPDGSTQNITYNDLGSHASVNLTSGSGQTIEKARADFGDYNASNQMQLKTLGNGVSTRYWYNSIGYLKDLKTLEIDCTSVNAENCIDINDYGKIQDLTYEFYDYGSVKNITDNRSIQDKIMNEYDTDANQFFEYDELGRLTKAIWGTEANPDETITYQYDDMGNILNRVTDKESPIDLGKDYFFKGDYDEEVGNMTEKRTWDASGNEIKWNYTYDHENRLVAVKKDDILTTEFTYDHRGQRVSKLFLKSDGSKVTTWYITPNYEIREIENPAGQVVSKTHTKYMILPGKGKLASVTEEYDTYHASLFGAKSHFRYAGLITVESLDSLANKLQHYLVGFSIHPKSGLWLRRAINTIFVLVFLALVWISWRKREQQNRSSFKAWQRFTAAPLLCVFFLVSCQAEYAKDGDRVITSDNGIMISGPNYDLDDDTIDGPPDGVYYYHTDHLGSSTVITRNSTTENPELIVTRIAYNPFGQLVQRRSAGTDSVTHKFTSQELDEETGLMYYNARFYDPSIGRFLTADTIVPDPTNAQHFNRYAYVTNNPIKYTDPTGHEPDEDEPGAKEHYEKEGSWGSSSGGGNDGKSDDDRSRDEDKTYAENKAKRLLKQISPVPKIPPFMPPPLPKPNKKPQVWSPIGWGRLGGTLCFVDFMVDGEKRREIGVLVSQDGSNIKRGGGCVPIIMDPHNNNRPTAPSFNKSSKKFGLHRPFNSPNERFYNSDDISSVFNINPTEYHE